MKRLAIAALWLLCISALAAAQDDAGRSAISTTPPSTAPGAPAKPDYSQEPYLFESYATKIRFENDGTGERENIAKIRVQSDAGVQALGELVFGFNSANERMNVAYVRVVKPDGSIVNAGPDAAKEMTAAVERDAPVYTDYKEKHITVPSLKPGDTLEYDIDTKIATAFAPGEFWYAQNFLQGGIILDENLEVNLPKGRGVKIASAGFDYDTKNENNRTIYTWKHSEITRPTDEEEKKAAVAAAKKAPDVQFTTFKNWAEVGSWYAKLEEGRKEATPEIRAKVEELIKGKTTDAERVQPLYDYVAKNIRYVSLSFGMGRYQPHTAAEVFANQYGDCKDKATLLAAMMRVAGITSEEALIPATSKLDETMPSPSQFDHMITAVQQGANLLWMDSTTEVAPFRLLAAPLRDKSALLISADGTGKIVKTPADPPFPATQVVEVEGQINDLGTLSGTVHYKVRGDQELLLRIVFRHAPKNKWKEVGDTILRLDGLDASAASVEASDPDETQDPFELTIHFDHANFLPWSTKQTKLELPLLTIGLPDAAQDNKEPIELGSPLAVTTRLKLTLPANYKARAPIAVGVTRDYAEFKSSYSLEGKTLTAERSLNFKMRELPAERTSDYLSFAHAVQSDENQTLLVESLTPGTPQLPTTASASELFDAGRTAFNSGDAQTAIPLLQKTVELEPQHKLAWNVLGLAYRRVGKIDEAITAYKKQLEVNPYDEHTNGYLAQALWSQQKYDDAVTAYHKQLEINPLDVDAHLGLGEMLARQHKYGDALPELEKASALAPDNALIEVELGNAYLNTGDKDKALEAFDKGASISQSPVIWNNIAYDMADQKLELDKARQYAESAVASIAADSRNIDLAHLTIAQYRMSETLATFWDTLGWVHFQQGDLQKAERYIRAAWRVDQHGAMGDHLGQILAKQGSKDRASDAYALTLASRNPDPDTRSHMMLLLGGNEKIDALVNQARPELTKQRTFSAGKLLSEKAEADFELLVSPAGENGATTKVESVKFLKGSEKLRPLGEKLRAIDFGTLFPDASPAKLVEIGTLACTAAGDCSFTISLPEDVHSLN